MKTNEKITVLEMAVMDIMINKLGTELKEFEVSMGKQADRIKEVEAKAKKLAANNNEMKERYLELSRKAPFSDLLESIEVIEDIMQRSLNGESMDSEQYEIGLNHVQRAKDKLKKFLGKC